MTWALLALLTTSAATEVTIDVGLSGGAIVPIEDPELRPSWLLAPRVGVWFDSRIGIEGQVGFTTARDRLTDTPYVEELAHLTVAVDVLPVGAQSPVHPLIHAGAGVLHAGGGATRTTGLGTAGVGLLIPVIGPMAVRVDARAVVHGDGNDALVFGVEATAGVTVRLGLTSDRDHDTVRDRRDKCPTVAEDPDGFEDEDGCPDPDNDGDGIPDVLDGCPLEPETPDGYEDVDGCPEYDHDGDGIRGKRDRCPTLAEDFDGVEDHDGCPEECMALMPPELGGDPDNLDGCPEDF